jgi:hypothetical protein
LCNYALNVHDVLSLIAISDSELQVVNGITQHEQYQRAFFNVSTAISSPRRRCMFSAPTPDPERDGCLLP